MNTEDRGPFSAELVPFPVVDRLPGVPAPADMRDLITDQFNRAVQRERDQRGDVHSVTDVHRMVRAVEGFRELMGEYARAFDHVAGHAKAVHEEELFEAVGEQDGIPMGSLTVPDGTGSKITVKAKTANKYEVDRDQVVAALVALVADEWTRNAQHPTPADEPEEFAIAVANRALDMVGSVDLKVTHVRALADRLGQVGADKLAGIVLDAIRKTTLYKGVDVTRKAS